MTGPVIMLAAVEPSADAIGAELLKELKAKVPDATFVGCGGPKMAAEGFDGAFDISAFAVMGFTDVARVLPAAWARSRDLARICAEQSVDVAVFIDGWSFSRLAAKRIRKRAPATKIVKYAAPQVWASRPQRTEFVRHNFDAVLTLLPFEPPYFEEVGVPATFVGNPNFEQVAKTPRSGPAFRARHNLGAAPLLMVLPGSRKTEVSRLLPSFGDTVTNVSRQINGLKVVIAAAPGMEPLLDQELAAWPIQPLVIPSSERFDAFDAADVALAASGTVTTELAMTATPMIVAYRVDALTAYWARKVLVTPFVSIINVAANEMVIPERIQEDCTPEQLTADIVRLFTDEEARRRQLSTFRRVLPELIGAGQSSHRAASEIVRLLQGEDRVDLDSRA
ncbi:lipid-A-disaccharide synthase [Parvularcula sp. LCG005]|uniref:lipid-A-disaccharide synthase n=1 Tax=Parvularcula sp. LCG005 TaxID=3078805 RepID=UPI002942742D|nr:lipid-A-disaccharide synthase [Parvularcula sp. LCG005]WOI52751.1 lipid-A-disaccharide synthase [Parvularcula sp. LCG005]